MKKSLTLPALPFVMGSLLIFTTLATTLTAFSQSALAGFGAHGGGPLEAKFENYGRQVVALVKSLGTEKLPEIDPELLEQAVAGTLLVVVKQPQIKTQDGRAYPKKMVNIPNASPPTIEIDDDWNPEKQTIAEVLRDVLHEYLGILGVERDHYPVSNKFKKLLEASGIKFSSKSSPSSETPILLYQEKFETSVDGGIEGFTSLVNAEEVCTRMKKFYVENYFLVYCTYLEKTLLGSQRSVHGPWYHEEEIRYTVYGLKIYGIGRLGEESGWQTVYKSTELLDGLVSATFESKTRALSECNLVLAQDARSSADPRLERARCFASPVEAGPGRIEWLYEIKTQNPFIKTCLQLGSATTEFKKYT